MSTSDPHSLPDENLPLPPAPAGAKAQPEQVHSADDLPFPLPPDWFERQAAAAAAIKARDAAEVEAAAAAVAAAAKAEVEQAVGTDGKPLPPQMSREEAQRLAAHAALAASSSGRQAAALQHEYAGNALLAKRRWLQAASEFDAAARKADTPAEGRRFSDLATRARARPRLRRLILTALAGGVVMGGAFGVWLMYSPWLLSLMHGSAAKQAEAEPAAGLNAQVHVDAATTMGKLQFANSDDATPWSEVAKQARHALAQAGISLAAVQEILDRATAQERLEAKDFELVDQSRIANPSAALAAAATFRATHKRAQDYRERLPLPGRLLMRGCDPSHTTVTIDGTVIPADRVADVGGVVFCRSPQLHSHVSVECPGYTPVTIDVPGSDSLDEKAVTATLSEIPQWRLHAPPVVPTWITLRSADPLLVVAQSAGIQAVSSTTGQVVETLTINPDALDGMSNAPFTWTRLLDSPPALLWATTSTGALIQANLSSTGFSSPALLLVGSRQVVALGQGSLVFQLNKHAWFNISQPTTRLATSTLPPNADRLTPAKTTAQLTASADGAALWSMPLTAVHQPYLQVVGEAIVAVDDLSLRIIDQDGKTQHLLEWPATRNGPIFTFAGDELLLSTCGSQVAWFSHRLTAPAVSVLPEALSAVAAHGNLLLGRDAQGALCLWQLHEQEFSLRWSMSLAGAVKPQWFALSDTHACYTDQFNAVHVLSVDDHKEIHTILLDTPLLAPPLLSATSVILADRFGQVRAYGLSAP